MKTFHELRPEFTVDRFTDSGAPTANKNSFSRLVNFIPSKGQMSTRLGIEEVTHTPDTSGQPYDPYADPDVVLWLRHESNATVRDCEVNGIDYMDMDTGVLTASNTTYWEGGGSGYYNAYVGSPQLRKTTNLLPTGFPACDDDEGYLITFFLKLDWFPSAGEAVQILVKQGVAGGSDIYGQFNFACIRSAGWSYARPLFVAYDAAGASTTLEANFNMFQAAHVGIWTSKTLGLMGIRIRNADTGGSVTDATHVLFQGTSVDRNATRRFNIGSNGASGKFRGYIDDLICYKNMAALDTEAKINAKIDAIFDRL